MAHDCTGCEHTTALHFQDVDGVVRCLWSASGVSDRGVIGMPWSITCDCADYISEQGNYRREARAREKREREEFVARIAEHARKSFEKA